MKRVFEPPTCECGHLLAMTHLHNAASSAFKLRLILKHAMEERQMPAGSTETALRAIAGADGILALHLDLCDCAQAIAARNSTAMVGGGGE